MPLELPPSGPEQTAILLIDLQYGLFEPHADEARAQELLACAVQLADSARRFGVRVVHCTKFDRPGFVGWTTNTPAWRRRARSGASPMLLGSRAATVLAELGPAETDLVVPRSRGASPFTGTELDPTLRNLGCTTIVLVGISLNIAVVTTCTEGISLGYEVVLPRDAVLGFPYEYGDAMIENSFRVMATIVGTRDLLEAWARRWSANDQAESSWRARSVTRCATNVLE